MLRRVCVYCASSRRLAPVYYEVAGTLGRRLADHDITVVYGGASIGCMGALADAALEAGGRVVGVIPRFMYDLELAHEGISELHLVADMHERKRRMLQEVDGIVALPGGTGTFEELFEAITWKRLGLHGHPVVIVNVGGYFDPCLQQLQRCIDEGFMDPRHARMWSVVEAADEVVEALRTAPAWDPEARRFAAP